MLKYLYVILFIFLLNGQDAHPRKNMKIMMKWKLTEYLDLNEDQAEKFFPKMNMHEKKIRQINNKIKLLKENLESQINLQPSNPVDVYEAKYGDMKNNKNNIEKLRDLEKTKIDIKADYLLSLQTVLDPNQLSKLLIFDKKFKTVLREELRNKNRKYIKR